MGSWTILEAYYNCMNENFRMGFLEKFTSKTRYKTEFPNCLRNGNEEQKN